ncbi:MAG: 50S ribosome-binding GTPase [Synergistaceae bacterium]|nr:50S ribosome-binding GTPase [Synergistaceae bacterium]
MEDRDIFQELSKAFQELDIGEAQKVILLENLHKLQEQNINIMITGATGSGKSSTINAMFRQEVAKVGIGVDPETMDITKYTLKNMILWDSPGLGDGKEADTRHAKNIISKLNERDSDGNALIDLVLVILDGGSRDLGTSYELINSVIIPNLGDNKEKRILVAINQCDMAMKGKHWDSVNNRPDSVLTKFLDEKAESVRRRIREGTGVDIMPVYYSAGYKDGDEQQAPYNLSKLLYLIIQHTPKKKRLIIAQNTSRKAEVWRDNDELKNYGEEIRRSFVDTVVESVSRGADIGGEIGSIFGTVGETVGMVVGGVAGFIGGVVKSIFSWW